VTALADATVYLLRHGRAELNAAGRLRGRIDVALDDVGRREAAALAERFTGVAVALVASSPLIRVIDTATERAGATGAPCRVEDAMVDRDFGEWAGHGRADVEARCGSLDAAPGVETFDAVATRSVERIERLVTVVDGPVVVVAHDAVNRVGAENSFAVALAGVSRDVIGVNRDVAVAPNSLGAPTQPIAKAANTAKRFDPQVRPSEIPRRTEYVSDGIIRADRAVPESITPWSPLWQRRRSPARTSFRHPHGHGRAHAQAR
jgi:broad specificity phosphatase PhoE